MNPEVQFTYLSRPEIQTKLAEEGIELSLYFVDKLLEKMGLSRQKMSKTGTYKQPNGRNDQFENIAELIASYTQAKQIVISIDSKKKEFLGQLYRPGKVYCNTAQVCNDHDFPSQATGKVVPYGVYDLNRNEGYMFLGQSADTADFAADCLLEYHKYYGSKMYSEAKEMLILCDAGGSNGARNRRFKEKLHLLANHTGLKIRVAHYPSYCSKYNPCDHRLFPHVTRALAGVMLDSAETIKKRIKSRAKTKEGLKVFVRKMKKEYVLGVKPTMEFLDTYPIVHHDPLPKWNYSAIPRP